MVSKLKKNDLHGGAQLTIDTKLVSPSMKRGADRTDGAAPTEAMDGKNARIQSLQGRVAGPSWSSSLRRLADGGLRRLISSWSLWPALWRSPPFLLGSKTKAGCFINGVFRLAVLAKSFASSLLDGFAAGVDGSIPFVDDMLGERRVVS